MDVLRDKTYIKSDKYSRYTAFPIYYNISTEKYQHGTISNLSQKTAYSLYTVNQGDTWDSIALNFYGNPTYYWVVCSFNRVRDPFRRPVAGQVIAIPNISDIEFMTYG